MMQGLASYLKKFRLYARSKGESGEDFKAKA